MKTISVDELKTYIFCPRLYSLRYRNKVLQSSKKYHEDDSNSLKVSIREMLDGKQSRVPEALTGILVEHGIYPFNIPTSEMLGSVQVLGNIDLLTRKNGVWYLWFFNTGKSKVFPQSDLNISISIMYLSREEGEPPENFCVAILDFSNNSDNIKVSYYNFTFANIKFTINEASEHLNTLLKYEFPSRLGRWCRSCNGNEFCFDRT